MGLFTAANMSREKQTDKSAFFKRSQGGEDGTGNLRVALSRNEVGREGKYRLFFKFKTFIQNFTYSSTQTLNKTEMPSLSCKCLCDGVNGLRTHAQRPRFLAIRQVSP